MKPIKATVYLSDHQGTPPMDVVYGSDVPIELTVGDVEQFPQNSTAAAYANEFHTQTVYVNQGPVTVTGNKIKFTPDHGFFAEGDNFLVVKVHPAGDTGDGYPFPLIVHCHHNPAWGTIPANPVDIKGYAEEAKASAEQAAAVLYEIKTNYPMVATLSNDVNRLKEDLTQASESIVDLEKTMMQGDGTTRKHFAAIWHQGSFTANGSTKTVTYSDVSTRCRSEYIDISMVPIGESISFNVPSEYRWYMNSFDTNTDSYNQAYIRATWTDGGEIFKIKHEFQNEKYFMFMLIRKDGGNIETPPNVSLYKNSESELSLKLNESAELSLKLKEDLSLIANTVCVEKTPYISQASTGWKLDGLGGCVSDGTFAIDKYGVTAGEIYYVDTPKDSEGVIQFQTVASIPTGNNPNLVGDVITTAYRGYIKVPEGASYMMVCRKKTTSNIVKRFVYTTARDIDAVSTAVNAIELNYMRKDGSVRDYLGLSWEQGGFAVNGSSKTISYSDSVSRVRSPYIDVTGIGINDTIHMHIPSGMKAYVVITDTNTDSYNNAYILLSWVTGDAEISRKFINANYMIVMCINDAGTIVPDDAKAITAYTERHSKILTDMSARIEDVHSMYIGDAIGKDGFTQTDGYYRNINGSAIKTSSAYSYVEGAVYAGTIITIPQWDDDSDVISHLSILDGSSYRSIVNAKDHRGKSVTIIAKEDCKMCVSTRTERVLDFELAATAISNIAQQHDLDKKIAQSTVPVPCVGQILYNADTANADSQIVNAVAYNDGTMIVCRTNGVVARIDYGGEHELLNINGTNMDWRCVYMDSNENVYVSPHASSGTFTMSKRGLYRLSKGASAFSKVIEFDNTTQHDDTIWTMCEDANGYIYAGVYCHTKRYQPRIYRSADNGITWELIYDFTGKVSENLGKHIHSLIYNKFNDALYCIVGEINTIYKSVDHGVSWTDLGVALAVKGSAMIATPYGVLIGSDGVHNCDIDILFNDDKTTKTVHHGWASTVFAMRYSDISGMVYAFTKIDSSVTSATNFPPVEVLSMTDPWVGIEQWKTGLQDYQWNLWKRYYDSCIDKYPDDAIRPQHYAILISRDGGIHWDVLHKWNTDSTHASGFWTTGYFRNGECLTGHKDDSGWVNPIVISEGKHKYTADGIDLTGEIFVRTNTTPYVQNIGN